MNQVQDLECSPSSLLTSQLFFNSNLCWPPILKEQGARGSVGPADALAGNTYFQLWSREKMGLQVNCRQQQPYSQGTLRGQVEDNNQIQSGGLPAKDRQERMDSGRKSWRELWTHEAWREKSFPWDPITYAHQLWRTKSIVFSLKLYQPVGHTETPGSLTVASPTLSVVRKERSSKQN